MAMKLKMTMVMMMTMIIGWTGTLDELGRPLPAGLLPSHTGPWGAGRLIVAGNAGGEHPQELTAEEAAVVAATSWQVMPAGANQSDWQFMPYVDTAGAPVSDRPSSRFSSLESCSF